MNVSTSQSNATAAPGTILILSSQDLQAVMRFDDYVDAVAEAFRMLAEGRCESPVPLQVSVTDGTFHAKAASLPVGPGYVAVKVNGNFPDNRSRHESPTIQGVVFLADASNGRPLALLDSREITRQRTAAASGCHAVLGSTKFPYCDDLRMWRTRQHSITGTATQARP